MNLPHSFGRRAAGLLSGLLMITPAFAALGTVDAAKGLNLRNSAGTDAAVLTVLPNGAQVEVDGVTEDGWYQVTYKKFQGFVSGEYVILDEDEAQSVEKVEAPRYGRVTEGPLNVRSGPGVNNDKIRRLAAGTVIQIQGETDGWYEISDGFVSGEYVELIDASAAAAAAGSGSQIVDYAKQYLGYPYVYGGASPKGFDCSGFVQYVFSHFGVSLGHSASSQINKGVSVSRENLQPGDLVFFAQTSSGRISHVGIYIGGDNFIHASSPSTGVIVSSMDSHTARGYVGACRIL